MRMVGFQIVCVAVLGLVVGALAEELESQQGRDERVGSPHDNHDDDKPVKSTAVSSKRNQETHETTVSYWTPDKMRSATPVDLERSHRDKGK